VESYFGQESPHGRQEKEKETKAASDATKGQG
jgi:hypothetical protein